MRTATKYSFKLREYTSPLMSFGSGLITLERESYQMVGGVQWVCECVSDFVNLHKVALQIRMCRQGVATLVPRIAQTWVLLCHRQLSKEKFRCGHGLHIYLRAIPQLSTDISHSFYESIHSLTRL
jgi:hypothetical protein